MELPLHVFQRALKLRPMFPRIHFLGIVPPGMGVDLLLHHFPRRLRLFQSFFQVEDLTLQPRPLHAVFFLHRTKPPFRRHRQCYILIEVPAETHRVIDSVFSLFHSNHRLVTHRRQCHPHLLPLRSLLRLAPLRVPSPLLQLSLQAEDGLSFIGYSRFQRIIGGRGLNNGNREQGTENREQGTGKVTRKTRLVIQ
jgi:hypothetical protein